MEAIKRANKLWTNDNICSHVELDIPVGCELVGDPRASGDDDDEESKAGDSSGSNELFAVPNLSGSFNNRNVGTPKVEVPQGLLIDIDEEETPVEPPSKTDEKVFEKPEEKKNKSKAVDEKEVDSPGTILRRVDNTLAAAKRNVEHYKKDSYRF